MEIKILNVRVPKEIVEWLDLIVQRGIYKSRSEAIRDYIREYIKENKGVLNGRCDGFNKDARNTSI